MKHLLLLFICTVSLLARGQEVIPYSQTFDGTTIPANWTTVDNVPNTPEQVWTFGTSSWDKIPALDGNYALLDSYDYGDGYNQNADLISPSFDLSSVSNPVVLHFDHFYYQFLSSSATLSYSIDNGANWTPIKTWNYSSSNGETFNQVINNVAGESQVKFKWNYTGSWEWGWAVDNVSVTELNARTWTGGTSSDWNAASNWAENAVPDASSNVFVNSGTATFNPTISDAGVECYSLTIGSTDQITIQPEASLIVYNSLTNNNSNDGVVIESNSTGTGSLIAASTASTGTTEVQVYVTSNQWHNVSPPVVQTVASFLSDNANIPTKDVDKRGLLDYNTTNDSWNDYFTNSTVANFEPAKGYLLRTSTDDNITFHGTITSGSTSISISSDGNAWNLIGNPYSSAICLNFPAGTNNFLTYNESSVDPSYFGVYIWDEGAGDYEIINNASGSEFAAVGQGFFVKAASSTSADFEPEMQVHQPTSVLKSEIIIPEIKLTVSNGTKDFSTNVKFFKDATFGLDKGFDAGIFKADKTFSIYTHLVEDNTIEFGVQCLPFLKSETVVIPVGVDYTAGGEVTLSLSALTVSDYNLVLEDRLLNKFTSFNESGSFYTATLAAETKGIGRFYLHVKSAQTTGIENLAEVNTINAWMDRDEIVVNGVTKNNVVAKLFDARGSLILMKNLENTSTNRIKVNSINTGIYMLQVIENGKRTGIKLHITGNK